MLFSIENTKNWLFLLRNILFLPRRRNLVTKLIRSVTLFVVKIQYKLVLFN